MTLSPVKTQQFSEVLRIFVVVQDTAILNFIRNQCAERNYEVVTCSTDSLARNLLKEAHDCFDIILIDAQMPELNSDDFVKYAKQQLQIKIPIILMTDADVSQSAMEKDFRYKADEIFDKPLNNDCTKRMLRAVINKKCENGRKQVQKKKGGRDNIENEPITNGTCVVEKDNNDIYQHKKKSVWKWKEKKELRQRFLQVVEQLGGLDNAKAMKIVELMNVPGLTRKHVYSYLQKCKMKLSKDEGVRSIAKPGHNLNVPLDSVNRVFGLSPQFNQSTVVMAPEFPNLSPSVTLDVQHSMQEEQNFNVPRDSLMQMQRDNTVHTEHNHDQDNTNIDVQDIQLMQEEQNFVDSPMTFSSNSFYGYNNVYLPNNSSSDLDYEQQVIMIQNLPGNGCMTANDFW